MVSLRKISNKKIIDSNYFNSFTNEKDLNNEIKILELNIKKLKRMKTKFRLINKLKLNKNQLKRTFDFNVEHYKNHSNNPKDNSNNFESSLSIDYKYTMIEFESHTNIIKKTYNISYYIYYNCLGLWYDNRCEPEIEAGCNLSVWNEEGKEIEYEYDEENYEIKYDNSGGDWGYVLKSILSYVKNNISENLTDCEGKKELIDLFS